jgi:hypothetical protein
MVRALLDGSKTQTRRIVKKAHDNVAKDTAWAVCPAAESGWIAWFGEQRTDIATFTKKAYAHGFPCPYGQPGDRLRVKENAWMWCEIKQDGLTKTGKIKIRYEPMRKAPIHYHADHPHKPLTTIVSPDGKWGWRMKVGRFLPSWASRITLEIVNVRVERLQDISADDAKAEGVYPTKTGLYAAGQFIDEYRLLWESINGSGSWDANPWVWVIEFKRVDHAAA